MKCPVIETRVVYLCPECHTHFYTEAEARRCEERHESNKLYMKLIGFHDGHTFPDEILLGDSDSEKVALYERK